MFGLNSFGDFSMVCGANSFISSIWILLKIYVPDHDFVFTFNHVFFSKNLSYLERSTEIETKGSTVGKAVHLHDGVIKCWCYFGALFDYVCW